MKNDYVILTDEDKENIFIFLDALRESGVTNMHGATPYIVQECYVGRVQAKELLIEWMNTFTKRHAND